MLLWSSAGGPKDVEYANDTFVINPDTNKWAVQTVFVYHAPPKTPAQALFEKHAKSFMAKDVEGLSIEYDEKRYTFSFHSSAVYCKRLYDKETTCETCACTCT